MTSPSQISDAASGTTGSGVKVETKLLGKAIGPRAPHAAQPVGPSESGVHNVMALGDYSSDGRVHKRTTGCGLHLWPAMFRLTLRALARKRLLSFLRLADKAMHLAVGSVAQRNLGCVRAIAVTQCEVEWTARKDVLCHCCTSRDLAEERTSSINWKGCSSRNSNDLRSLRCVQQFSLAQIGERAAEFTRLRWQRLLRRLRTRGESWKS
jgi:hypothetical protein